ncbi:DNA polymerase beta superfamily protein [Nocardia brasiliensis]|uniref:DNA polymerase beta superfamily protein n=1 Tax=Nocardia brasiliensis TaxID=37326 RepID=UPI00366C52C5
MSLRAIPASMDPVAPMHLPTLMDQCDLPAELVAAVAELTELKSRTREISSGTVPMPIAAFIESEFELAVTAFPKTADPDLERARTRTAEFFRHEAQSEPVLPRGI